MRVLHVSFQYRPTIGGAERHITIQSQALAQRGHTVDVCTARSTDFHTWRSTLPRFERLDGVNVYRFDAIERGPITWKVLNKGLQGYWHTRSPRYAPAIVAGNGPSSPTMILWMLRHGRSYDLIHSNSLHYATVSYSYLIARRLGIPFALTPFIHIDQPVIFDIEFQNGILRAADLVLAMTNSEKEYLISRGVMSERIAITGSGIHLPEYPRMDIGDCRRLLGIPDQAFVLLFLARKEKYKGLETLLEACSRLGDECPELYLVAAGPETEHSQSLRQRYSSLKRVIYFDTVPNETKLALLNACDVFGMLSVGESFGIAYLEAWAMGKPVMGASSGAIPDLVSNGVDGILADPVDPNDAAIKLAQLYRDRGQCNRLGQAGYTKLETRYTVEKVTNTIEGAYMRTIRRHRNTGHYRYRLRYSQQ